MDMVEISSEGGGLQSVIVKLNSGNMPDIKALSSYRKSGVLTIALSDDSNDEKCGFDTCLRVYGASLDETSRLLKNMVCEKGFINLNLRDFSNVLKDGGGTGVVFVSRGTGQNRLPHALSRIRSTKTEPGFYSARNILLDISFSNSNWLVMSEMLAVKEFMGLFFNYSETKLQLRIDDSLGQQVGVFLIVTRIDKT